MCVLGEVGCPAFWLQQPQCPLHPDWGPGGKALWAWVPWDRMYELPSRLPGCTHTSTWEDTGGADEGGRVKHTCLLSEWRTNTKHMLHMGSGDNLWLQNVCDEFMWETKCICILCHSSILEHLRLLRFTSKQNKAQPYCTQPIPLLLMPWRHKEPGHQ